ncbi:MAG: hypothetical protein IJ092_14885 [Atopobiaceae bacterium]|nr:hypothetical protein [Atopobiaceae bacterium]
MAEIERELSTEELEKVAGGFPDGDFPEGVNICPRCGGSDLTVKGEGTVDSFGSPVVDSVVTNKSFVVYECNECGCRFYRYGPFYEFIN